MMEEEEECWGSWSWQRKTTINGSMKMVKWCTRMSCFTPVPSESMGNILGVFRHLSTTQTENGDNSITPAGLFPALKEEGGSSLLSSRLASSPICCSVTMLKHTVPVSRANYGAICLYLSATKAQYKLGSVYPVIFCREIKWSYVESS